MKKLLLVLMLSGSCYAQDSFEPVKFELKDTYTTTNRVKTKSYSGVTVSPSLGIGMIGGGAVFILAGALTTPTYEGGSTTILKPWYAQPGFYPIASGAILITAGIIISLNY